MEDRAFGEVILIDAHRRNLRPPEPTLYTCIRVLRRLSRQQNAPPEVGSPGVAARLGPSKVKAQSLVRKLLFVSSALNRIPSLD